LLTYLKIALRLHETVMGYSLQKRLVVTGEAISRSGTCKLKVDLEIASPVTTRRFWNQLLPSTGSTLLTGEPNASFRSLKTALFYLGSSHWKPLWLVCTARGAM